MFIPSVAWISRCSMCRPLRTAAGIAAIVICILAAQWHWCHDQGAVASRCFATKSVVLMTDRDKQWTPPRLTIPHMAMTHLFWCGRMRATPSVRAAKGFPACVSAPVGCRGVAAPWSAGESLGHGLRQGMHISRASGHAPGGNSRWKRRPDYHGWSLSTGRRFQPQTKGRSSGAITTPATSNRLRAHGCGSGWRVQPSPQIHGRLPASKVPSRPGRPYAAQRQRAHPVPAHLQRTSCCKAQARGRRRREARGAPNQTTKTISFGV